MSTQLSPADVPCAASVTATRRAQKHNLIAPLLVLLVVVFAYHASLRGLSSDYDAAAYANWFEVISRFSIQEFWEAIKQSNVYFQGDLFFSFEIGFAILSFVLTRLVGSVEGFFFLMTLLSLSLKVFAIYRSCPKPAWAMAWYFSWFYLLLELTTQRAGIAASIVLLGFSSLLSGRYLRFALITVVAAFFHVSAVMALLLIPLRIYPFGPKALIAAMLISFALSTSSLLPLINWAGQFNAKVAEYYTLFITVGLYESINKFNLVVILRLFLLAFGVFGARAAFATLPGYAFATNVYAASIFFYYAFASFPVVGGRAYELLGVFQIYFIGYYALIFRRNMLAKGFLLMVILMQFYVLVFHVKFVDFFYFIGNSYNIETQHRL